VPSSCKTTPATVIDGLAGANSGCGGKGSTFSQSFYDQALAVQPGSAGNTVAFGGVGTYISSNSGAAWTFLGAGGGVHSDVHALQFDPFNSNILYAGTNGGLFEIDVTNPNSPTITSLTGSGANTIVAAQLYSVGPHLVGTGTPAADAQTFLAGVQDNSTALSAPLPTASPTPSLDWNEVDTGPPPVAPGDSSFTLFDSQNPNVAYHAFSHAGAPAPAYSTSGGTAGSWTVSPPTLGSGDLGAQFFAPLAADPAVSQFVLLGSFYTYASANNMQSWTQQTTMDLTRGCVPPGSFPCVVTDLSFAPSNHTKGYAVTGITTEFSGSAPGGFYVWHTGGANLTSGTTWTEITGNLRNNNYEQSYVLEPGGLTVDPDSASEVYLGLQCSPLFLGNCVSSLYKATPNGSSTSWSAVDGSKSGANPINGPVYKALIDSTDSTSNHLLAGTAAGLFMSSDGGADWTPYDADVIPPVPVLDIEQNSAGQIFVATHGAVAYKLAVPTFVGYQVNENECTGGSDCTVGVSAPTGVQDGDVLIVLIQNAGSSSITPLPGWDLLSFANVAGSPTSVTESLELCTNAYVDVYFSVFVHVYNSSDPSSYSFTVPRWTTSQCGGRWNEPTAYLVSYRGADQNLAAYVLNGYIDDTSGTTITAPATTVPGGETLVNIFQGYNTEANEDNGIKATLSAPSGSPPLTAETPLKSLYAWLDADAFTGPTGGTFGQYTVNVTGGYSGPTGVFQLLVPPL
jgi:hypothetical protein